MKKTNPIGVFDSGIGGLTVLEELIEQFPNEDFIYVADTLHCPYGIKSPKEIASLVTRVTNYLLKENAKAIVIACNTATANSAHLKEITDVPIVGVIHPTADYAAKVSKGKIAILATNATIDSGCYQNLLNKQADLVLYPVKCSEFVPLIENCKTETEEAFSLISSKLKDLQAVDTVILGCTHFPLIRKQISEILPQSSLVTCGKPTASDLYQTLKKQNLLTEKTDLGKVILCTTGKGAMLKAQIPWFTKTYQEIREIEI